MTNVAGVWYLFTWSPIGYRVPASADFVALCRTCMAHGNRAMAEIPVEIADAFGLVKLSEAETEAVYQAIESDVEVARDGSERQ